MSDVGRLDALLAAKRELDATCSATPQAAQRLRELQAWQAARLARTYDDLRGEPRYAAAVEFFLSDLYGPHDFTRRDAQFTRAWRRLKRGLPAAALQVLGLTIELQVLSAELDQAMLSRLGGVAVSNPTYAKAYREVGRRDARQRQIDLLVEIGTELQRVVTLPVIGLMLKAAHLPAHLAGLGALQGFLERGFGAFRRMGSAQVLLEAVRSRETALMQALFAGCADPFKPATP